MFVTPNTAISLRRVGTRKHNASVLKRDAQIQKIKRDRKASAAAGAAPAAVGAAPAAAGAAPAAAAAATSTAAEETPITHAAASFLTSLRSEVRLPHAWPSPALRSSPNLRLAYRQVSKTLDQTKRKTIAAAATAAAAQLQPQQQRRQGE